MRSIKDVSTIQNYEIELNRLLQQVLSGNRLDGLLFLRTVGIIGWDPVQLLVTRSRLNPDLVQQLKRLGVFDIQLLNSALSAGNLHNVELLMNEGLQLSDDLSDTASVMSDVVNYAAPMDIIRILEWLEQKGFRPTQETAGIAALDSYPNVLDWLERRGILPAVGISRDVNDLDTLLWLNQRGL